MSAVGDVVLTVLAAMFAGLALSLAASVYVPRPTRVVCFIVGVPAGLYALTGMPTPWAVGVVGFLLVCLLVDAVRQRPRWNRHAARAVSRARVDGTRSGRVFLAWLTRRLSKRRDLAEAIAGVALQAMANSCESCERAEAWCRVQYPDGKSFRVCGMCGAAAIHHGAVRSFS